MNSLKNSTLRLCAQIGLLVLLYFICRLLFILNYNSQLGISGIKEFSKVVFGGMRFDLSAIFATNLLFIFFSLLPFKFKDYGVYKLFLKTLFIVVNSICLLMNIIDVAYFSFIQKRMQFDALGFLSGSKGNDFFNLLPKFFLEYWYLLFIFLILILLLVRGYNKSLKINVAFQPSLSFYLKSVLLCVFFIGLSIIFIRGGFQLKPLNVIHASQMTAVKNIPAILNSPFSVIKTANKKGLKKLNYFPEEQIRDLGIHHVKDLKPNNKNVIIIIIESLSKRHLGYFNGKGHTPFLDSIFANSAVFTNGFANARESIQGIPAIVSSIPSWQDEPFIFSNFSTNKITSLPSLLREKGYSSSFFHGGTNGTMGFNAYSSLAEFDKYYGREEYNNENDFDGNWGIWDEPFLQFMADKLSKTKQPFLSTVFTLNPHHPFQIPEKYKQNFKEDEHPFFSSLRYTDYALSKFFGRIKNEPWFKNTIFVFTADHTAPAIDKTQISSLEDHRIPIAFYLPDNSLKGEREIIANQIDILPSVLYLAGFSDPYFSLGNNLFKPKDSNAMYYSNGVYHLVDDSIIYLFNGNSSIGVYNWRTDGNLKNNILEDNKFSKVSYYENLTKQKIQVFNNKLIENSMYIRSR